MFQKIFWGKGQARPEGQKNTDLSSYLSHLTSYWSENENLSIEIKTKLKSVIKNFGQWPRADWPTSAMPIFDHSSFLHKTDPQFFL